MSKSRRGGRVVRSFEYKWLYPKIPNSGYEMTRQMADAATRLTRDKVLATDNRRSHHSHVHMTSNYKTEDGGCGLTSPFPLLTQ